LRDRAEILQHTLSRRFELGHDDPPSGVHGPGVRDDTVTRDVGGEVIEVRLVNVAPPTAELLFKRCIRQPKLNTFFICAICVICG
jgi:hypothetical protein